MGWLRLSIDSWRKYNISDRDRISGSIDISYQPTDRLAIDANIELSKNDYDATLVGLTSSDQTAFMLDASYQLNKALSGHAYFGKEFIDSEQSGSQVPDQPDWFVENENTVDSLGFGIKWQKSRRLNLGADYIFSGSKGKTHLTSLSPTPPVSAFPDLTTKLHSLKLFADYKWSKKVNLKLSYLYEKYNVDDWSTDGVNAGSIPDVLLLGESNPSYTEHMIGLTVVSRF